MFAVHDQSSNRPHSMTTTESILSEFSNPSNEFRPWPLFVLNDEYLPGAGEARLTELLENMARVGYGGVFLHPRPGLITEYLSPRWFEIIRHCISECRRLGMIPALYDENSYPSGFAGGHVPALAPQTTARYLLPKFGTLPEKPPANALAVYRVKDGIPVEQLALEALPECSAWCAFVLERMEPMAWHGDFSYTSLLDPVTTEKFLETTYERYRDELGEANWKACAAFFTDEPHLPADSHGPWGRGLHFSRLLQAEFSRRRGYPIEGVLADLYFNSATSSATRFDFYETVHELWLENFARPVAEWCTKNGIPSTGHYLEHDWPCPYATPGHVHLLAQMDWPGTDYLECFGLEGHDYGDPQNFDPAVAGTEPHALYYLKQVQSIANQLEKKRVMNESWGAGGHDSTPLDWLRIGRFLAVHGVNLFVPHYSTTTIRGARKKDHPQFFSEQSPWFDALGLLNTELARLSWLVSRGVTRQRILVIDLLSTAYCAAEKSDCLAGESGLDAISDPMSVLADTQRSLRGLRQAAGALAQALSDAQVDFDIGDEYVLVDSGEVSGDRLRVGIQSYEVVVLPPGLRNLRKATLAMLNDFARAGGRIIGIRPADSLLDGRASDWPAHLMAEWVDSPEELSAATVRQVPPRLQFATPPPTGVAHQRRECEEGIYYLIVNSSPHDWTAQVSVSDAGAMHWLDPQSGKIGVFDGQLHLAAESAGVILVSSQPLSKDPLAAPKILSRPGTPLEFVEAHALEPNILAIDYCELEVRGEKFPRQLVYESNRIFWNKNGMETNGWAAVVQFRDNLMQANARMSSDSGGIARYSFIIEPGVHLADIDLCFECPEHWQMRVNGQAVEASGQSRWLDCHIVRVKVGHLLREGENFIELVARPFDVRQEIDQIYLLGSFAARPHEPGFVLAPVSAPMALGSWKSQGLPFYDRKVTYHFRRPHENGRVLLSRADWYGSVLELTCGERRIQTYGPHLDVVLTAEDSDHLSITITGLPLNLLGPWHMPGFLPKHAWSNFWHDGAVPNAPQAGADYHLLDLGLFAAPVWISGGD
jgi:hypothetical protein